MDPTEYQQAAQSKKSDEKSRRSGTQAWSRNFNERLIRLITPGYEGVSQILHLVYRHLKLLLVSSF